MAQRKEARIFVTIWNDPVFRAHRPNAQRMYLYLLSQIDLSYCGVISLRVRRWAKDADGLTTDEVEASLEALAKPFPEGFREGSAEGVPEGGGGPLVVIDEDAGELLVRTLIRNDGIWRQPNLLKAARESAMLVRSPRIKAALVEELRRIPVDESPSKQVRAIIAEFAAELGKGLPNPSAKGSRKGSGNPSAEGSGDPSAKGLLGDRGRSTTCIREPLTPETPEPHPPREGARAHARDEPAEPVEAPRPDGLTSIPDDFAVADSLRRWAISTFGEHLDLAFETEQFISHYRSTGARRKNWPEQWRKWIRDSDRRATERGRPSPGGNGTRPPRSTTDERVAQAQALKEVFRAKASQEQAPPNTITGEVVT